MKLIDLTCNKCGAQLKVNAELSKCMCQYCGNEMLIDQEVIHHKIDNAFDAGYQAELGRIKAQEDYKRHQIRMEENNFKKVRAQEEYVRKQEEYRKQQEEYRRQQEKQKKYQEIATKTAVTKNTCKHLMIICILIEIIIGIICKLLGANDIGLTTLMILSVASWICKHLSGDRVGIIGFTIDGIIPMTIGMILMGTCM